MAALDGTHFTRVWDDGRAERVGLYALKNVSAGDTLDLSNDFSVLKRAVLLGTTVNAAAQVSVNGTGIAIPAGANADAGYLLVWGCSS
jgi:hypothetical protein